MKKLTVLRIGLMSNECKLLIFVTVTIVFILLFSSFIRIPHFNKKKS